MTDKMIVAQGVANRLFATEKAIDAALGEASGLMGAMVSSREELRMSATVGTDAVAKLAEAVSALAQARGAVVEAHRELEEVKLRLGIRTRMLGEYQKTAAAPAEVRDTAEIRSIAG